MATERVSVIRRRVPSPERSERIRGEGSSLGAYGKTDDDEESWDDGESVRIRRMVIPRCGRRTPDRKRRDSPFIEDEDHSPPPNDRVI
jgi:hypothetical protein